MRARGVWLATLAALVASVTTWRVVERRASSPQRSAERNEAEPTRPEPAPLPARGPEEPQPPGEESDAAERPKKPATVAGIVLNGDGLPAAGVRVDLPWNHYGGPYRTNERGYFRVERVNPGPHTIEVATSNHPLAPKKEVQLSLGPGERRLDLKIRFPRAGTSYASLKIVDERKRPLAGWGVHVKTHPNSGDERTRFDGRAHLVLEGREDEICRVQVEPPPSSTRSLPFSCVLRTQASPGSDAVEVVVPDIIQLTFVVLDAHGAPVKSRPTVRCRNGASQDADPPKAPTHARTKWLHRGQTYDLSVRAQGFLDHRTRDAAFDADGGTVEIRLQRPGTIRAHILDESGKPLRRVRMGSAPESAQPLSLEPRGLFRHSPDRLGKVILVLLDLEKRSTFRSEVQVRPGEVTDLGEIRLAAPVMARGLVVNAEGAPASGAILLFEYRRKEGLFAPTEVTDRLGGFEIPLPPCADGWLFAIRPGRGGPATYDVAVVEVAIPRRRHPRLRLQRVAQVDITARSPSPRDSRTIDIRTGVVFASGGVYWNRRQKGSTGTPVRELVHPGRIRIRAQAGDGLEAETELTAEPGGSYAVALDLR